MILNSHIADPSQLKVIILSCPKTGNTWLRWLMHYAYRLPMVDLPLEWSDEHARGLPAAFVTHQHLWPTEELVRWLANNDAVVLTTIRHPADTLLSYFHFAKWHDLSSDPGGARLARDGERPGNHTLRFVKYAFTQAYSISLAWARLGAHVVRYEDLLEDPVRQLRSIASKIAPLDDYEVKAAVLLCKPDQMTRPGLVDPRHLRTATWEHRVRDLPPEIAETMAAMQPYKAACEAYGYDWDSAAPDPARFDYTPIDPFRGRGFFDNGEPVGPSLPKVYLHEVVNASVRWPDPTVTDGDSFWTWLRSPSEQGTLNAEFSPGTFTNLMAAVYGMRPDLQAAFPDPVGGDRIRFLSWFLGQAVTEFELPWGLISPVLDSYCRYLEAPKGQGKSDMLGRIARLAVMDARGREVSSFNCGDEVQIELQLILDQPLENAVIEVSLRGPEGRLVFGTNTSLLGAPLPTLDAGSHTCRIRSKLTVQPQSCCVSVGLARHDEAGGVEAICRMSDHKRITITGVVSSGVNWCETTISMDETQGVPRQSAASASGALHSAGED